MDAGNVRRVDILSGFTLAAGANADRIVFVVANVNDLGLKYLYDFIQKLEYQPVGIRVIGAIGIRIGIVIPLGQFRMGAEDIVHMAQRGLLGDNVQSSVPAVFHKPLYGFLGEHAAARVFKMNGILVPRTTMLHIIGALGICGHVLAILYPRGVDLGVTLVFHATAQFKQDGIHPVATGDIDRPVEFLQLVRAGQIQLKASEFAPGRTFDLAHGQHAAIFFAVLQKQVCRVQSGAQPGSLNANGVSVGEHAEGVALHGGFFPGNLRDASGPGFDSRKHFVNHTNAGERSIGAKRRKAINSLFGSKIFLQCGNPLSRQCSPFRPRRTLRRRKRLHPLLEWQ